MRKADKDAADGRRLSDLVDEIVAEAEAAARDGGPHLGLAGLLPALRARLAREAATGVGDGDRAPSVGGDEPAALP